MNLLTDRLTMLTGQSFSLAHKQTLYRMTQTTSSPNANSRDLAHRPISDLVSRATVTSQIEQPPRHVVSMVVSMSMV